MKKISTFVFLAVLGISLIFFFRNKSHELTGVEGAALTQKLDENCHVLHLDEACKALDKIKVKFDQDHTEEEACKKGNLGACHAVNGFAHATREYEKSITYGRIACDAGELIMCSNIAIDLMLLNRNDEAIVYGEKSCTAQFGEGCYNLVSAYCRVGNLPKAVKTFQRTIAYRKGSSQKSLITKEDVNADEDLKCIRGNKEVLKIFSSTI